MGGACGTYGSRGGESGKMVSLEDLAVYARITFNACLMYRMGWRRLD